MTGAATTRTGGHEPARGLDEDGDDQGQQRDRPIGTTLPDARIRQPIASRPADERRALRARAGARSRQVELDCEGGAGISRVGSGSLMTAHALPGSSADPRGSLGCVVTGPLGVVVPVLVALLDLVERGGGLRLARVGTQSVLLRQPSRDSTVWCLRQNQYSCSSDIAAPPLSCRGLRPDLDSRPTRSCQHLCPPAVPPHIARPEYVDRPAPAPYTGSEVKDAETIERMRVAGRLAAQALEEVGRTSRPGSPPTSSTGSVTSSSATTAPTPRRSATAASPSRCARASTR